MVPLTLTQPVPHYRLREPESDRHTHPLLLQPSPLNSHMQQEPRSPHIQLHSQGGLALLWSRGLGLLCAHTVSFTQLQEVCLR